MQGESMVIGIGPIASTVVGHEFPVAYRLVRRKGELALQGLFRETVTEQSRADPNDMSKWAHYQRDEWRDIPTVEESGDAGG